MHELGITQEVLNLALGEAKAAKAKRISRINLVVGEASGVVDDSVQFCFELLSSESIAKDAKLFNVKDKIDNKRLILPGHVAIAPVIYTVGVVPTPLSSCIVINFPEM